MADTIDADYLVVGAGAMGMAFVDTLLTDTNASIVLIDRYDRPGGHWTLAYPYVRLHQPSAFYGVNSRHLGGDKIDKVGSNKGLAELASVDELCTYYGQVMQQTFLPSGRVSYFPKHEYLGEGEFRSILTHKLLRVDEKTRIVDATFMKVKVPSMSPPQYEVGEKVNLITPNQLPSVLRPYCGYTVVGAGKTGVDAILWLLEHGIDPSDLTWITPRDSWFFQRGALQPGPAFAESNATTITVLTESIMTASSPDDLFTKLEEAGQLLRISYHVQPTMFRCATISLTELEQIRKVGKIVRQGRVQRIEEDKIILEHGIYTITKPGVLYIDCTADSLAKLAPTPVFCGRTITLQSVRYCQQVFSAAFIAHIEATYGNDENCKNDMCGVIPHPNEAMDYLIVTLQSHWNTLKWAKQLKTAEWLARARLDWFGTLMPPIPTDSAGATQFYGIIADICTKMEELIEKFPEKDALRAKAQLAQFCGVASGVIDAHV